MAHDHKVFNLVSGNRFEANPLRALSNNIPNTFSLFNKTTKSVLVLNSVISYLGKASMLIGKVSIISKEALTTSKQLVAQNLNLGSVWLQPSPKTNLFGSVSVLLGGIVMISGQSFAVD